MAGGAEVEVDGAGKQTVLDDAVVGLEVVVADDILRLWRRRVRICLQGLQVRIGWPAPVAGSQREGEAVYR
jgi:hypothetical protein